MVNSNQCDCWIKFTMGGGGGEATFRLVHQGFITGNLVHDVEHKE